MGTYSYDSNIIVLKTIKSLDYLINDILINFENYIEISRNNSGPFHSLETVEIKITKTKNIYGASFIELPINIKSKQACVNINNLLSCKKGIKAYDNKCFLWSLIASKHYDEVKKVECVYYKKEKYINSIIEPENTSYPIAVDSIPEWEKCNDMKINVFILDKNEQLELIYTNYDKNPNLVNLLLYNNHFIWLKNIDRFESSKTNHHSIFRCFICMNKNFDTLDKLNKHKINCLMCKDDIDEILPTKDKNDILKFKNINNTFKHPFYVVADFESTLKKIDDGIDDELDDELDEKNKSKKYQEHIANSFALKYNCIHSDYSKPIEHYNNYDDEDLIKNFVERLEEMAIESYELLQLNKDNIIMNNDEKQKHKKIKLCSECNGTFNKKNEKVRHHDHISGKYINTICNDCNLKLQYKNFLPIYLHNMKGYDAHLFVSGLFKYGYQKENKKKKFVKCIPSNEVRYISMSKIIKVQTINLNDPEYKPYYKDITFELRFLDTIRFLNESLENLVQNLKNTCYTKEELEKIENKINIVEPIDKLRKVFKNTSENFINDEQFLLMIQKGIYPYDYIDNYDRFNETKLPTIDDFYSKL